MCVVLDYYFDVKVTKHWIGFAYILMACLGNWMIWASFLIAYPRLELVEVAVLTNVLLVSPFVVKWYQFCVSSRKDDTLLEA